MKLESLLKSTKLVAVTGALNRDVSGVVCDSRQVRPGFLFVAVHGHSRDGAQYAEDALQRGAAAIVSEQPLPPRVDVPWAQAADARQALSELASHFHGSPSARLQMIGITGTNGKTTTAYMCRAMLQAAGRLPGLITTVEYRVGDRAIPAGRTTPEAPVLHSLLAQMVGVGCRSAVMEVSSHALDQKRAAAVDFDAGVFTNLSRDHLDYHKTFEQYFEAKAALFRQLGRQHKKAFAAVNTDDPWGQKLSRLPDIQAAVVSFGTGPQAMVRAENVALGPDGSRFTAITPWGQQQVEMNALGRHNVSNALAALSACGCLGVPLEVMGGALAAMPQVPGRLEAVATGRGFQVFVDYAHTDDALAKVLTTLRELTRRRLIVVFGCGGNRDVTKREPMGRVAAALADYSVITSDNPRREDPVAIMEQIRRGFDKPGQYETIEDRAVAIRRALALAQDGDVVLVAGKGHETFQEFASITVPFDDRAVVRKELPKT